MNQAARARAERDAHQFPLKSALPTPVELERLQRAFALALLHPPTNDWVIGAIALRLVLVSGRPVDEIHALRHASGRSTVSPRLQMPVLVELNGHAPALWLKAGRSAHLETNAPRSRHAGSPSKGVWLSLDPLSVALVNLITKRAPAVYCNDGTKRAARLFSQKSPKALAETIKSFRLNASKLLGSNEQNFLAKITKCALFLETRLTASVPGDSAISWLITNTNPKRNATKSYYTSVSLGDAQRYHRQAIQLLPAVPTSAAASPALLMEPPAALRERVIGSPFCPKQDAVEKLGAVLRSAATVGKGRLALTRATRIDHAFTAYCWLFFSLHTGWRPPRSTLLPSPADIDWERRAMLIEDKIVRSTKRLNGSAQPTVDALLEEELAAEDFVNPRAERGTPSSTDTRPSRRRWLPLSERVCKQLQNYYEHITARAHMRNRPHHKLVVTPLADRPALEAYLKALPGLNWDLPSNFNRHYLRSALIDRLCTDAIDAYLGHWEIGCEPWWNGSCIDPLAYTARTQGAISQLFTPEHWPVIEGFHVPAIS